MSKRLRAVFYEGIALKGHIRLTARDRAGRIVAIIESDNLIVTVGKELLAHMLIDDAGYDTGITYCAIGTGTTAPALPDTTLVTETNRLSIAANGSKSRAVNVITFSTFFLAAQCTYFIREIGLFGHSTATGAADSGVLLARGLLSYDNSAGVYDLTIDYVITIG